MSGAQKIELYRPSNGTEGAGFMAHYCENCKHDDHGEGLRVCEIIGTTMVYSVDEPQYPTEWQYKPDGWPTCTKFEAES